MRRRSFAAVLAAATLTLGLAACGSSDSSDSADKDTLKVGVSPVPHGEILKYVSENLAAAEGLKIEIVEFNDYIQPNVALSEKQLDANYFQHIPYLEEEVASKGYKFTALEPVHIEPLGVYSKTVKTLAEVPSGGVVGVPNDPSNSGRALALLAENGLITLKDGVGVKATEKDITANPKNLQFKALEAAQLPRSLEDTAISVINGNYAIETGLKPATDALVLETGDDNPYANLVVVRTGDETDARVVKLEKLLHSAEVKKFIEDKYQGSVLAAF
ncbi:D-methionine transport system substrate-binding protein [Actinoplanes campanulatus]|uniref:Lipoprotein n=1 Tax=Actinoplanes campanulatus TaxID=113559 RepID=A0A7W5FIH0_9ACTN|nr:MetQ/NlpA family ABC transporter substrate-binding protein [Actinoplanes campanulatus]MBB3099522.1 D-methionine transport system substrate-binding protein [Actinoplanes campanulatus]GGN42445.1 lipoprotein [Actinoplanes campanulatus]GID39871.1 lipoprotein [Actinoplanes campanulatus]